MRLRIVTQLSGLLMARYIRVLELLTVLRCKLVKLLRVNCTHIFQNVATQSHNLFVQLKLNIKLWLVQCTVRAQLIKAELINVLHKAGDLGQQLLTTVRQIQQRVLALLKRKR